MTFIKKSVPVAQTGPVEYLVAAKTWSVTWNQRTGPYSQDVRERREFLFSERDAVVFANTLKAAFVLIGLEDKSCNWVKVEEVNH